MKQLTTSAPPRGPVAASSSSRYQSRTMAVLVAFLLIAAACGGGDSAAETMSSMSLEEAATLCGVDVIRSDLENEPEETLVIKYNGLLARIPYKYQSRDTMPAHVVVLGEEAARLFANGDILDATADMDAALNCELVPGS